MPGTSRKRHPAAEIRRLLAGEATAEERRRVVRHLFRGCAHCGRRLRLRPGKSPDEAGLRAAIDRTMARSARLARQVEREKSEAERLIMKLRNLKPAGQLLLLANAGTARTQAVCEQLLDLAYAQRHEDGHECRRIAELTVVVAEKLPQSAAGDLPARAWGELGNARRICGDLKAAGTALDTAWELSQKQGVDPVFEASLLSLHASLEGSRRNFGRAFQLAERALGIFKSLGEDRLVGHTLILIGYLRNLNSEPKQGIILLQRALMILEPYDERELKLYAIHNLCSLTCCAGFPVLAAELAAEARCLYERIGGRLDQLRFQWVAAVIRGDLGHLEEARGILWRNREEWIAQGYPYNAAAVGLELALVAARLGRSSEVKDLAHESAEVFRSLRVARDLIAAMALEAQAGAQESADVSAIGEIAG